MDSAKGLLCPEGCGEGKLYDPLLPHVLRRHFKKLMLYPSDPPALCSFCNKHMRRGVVDIHKWLHHNQPLPGPLLALKEQQKAEERHDLVASPVAQQEEEEDEEEYEVEEEEEDESPQTVAY